MTTLPNPSGLTADAFIAWAADQPRGRFELAGGQIVAMAPERAGHTRTKARAHRALEDAIAAPGLDCEAFADGMSVRIDEFTVYEPDVLVRCGPRTPDDAVEVSDPLVVVEVVSRSSRGIDTGAKFDGYFRLASVAHYLVIDAEARVIVHHRRDDGGEIATRIHRGGSLSLDPPGLVLDVGRLFAPA